MAEMSREWKEPTIAMVFDGIMHIIKYFAEQSDIPVEVVLFNLMMYSKFRFEEEEKEQKCHMCKLRQSYLDATGLDHKWDTGCKFLCELTNPKKKKEVRKR